MISWGLLLTGEASGSGFFFLIFFPFGRGSWELSLLWVIPDRMFPAAISFSLMDSSSGSSFFFFYVLFFFLSG